MIITVLAATTMIGNMIREVSAMPTDSIERFLPEVQAYGPPLPQEQVAMAQE
ncbi:MAG: hypothetical protein AB7E85_04355 [Pseudobdellovibrionaceae bacterium]